MRYVDRGKSPPVLPQTVNKLSRQLLEGIRVEQSQGDGWIIRTDFGYIDYRPNPDEDTNEIWWVESKRRGHGSELVDLMQKQHPASNIAWGVTSGAGEGLMKKWHREHPDVGCIEGDHEGQFDPF